MIFQWTYECFIPQEKSSRSWEVSTRQEDEQVTLTYFKSQPDNQGQAPDLTPASASPTGSAQFSPLIPGAQNPRTKELKLLSLGSTGKLFWDSRATFKYIVGFCLMLIFILICLSNIWNFLIKAIQITDKANIHPYLLFLQYQFPPQRGPLGLVGWVVISFSLEYDMKSPVFSEGNSRHKELRLQLADFN